jgi:hypothetical protein
MEVIYMESPSKSFSWADGLYIIVEETEDELQMCKLENGVPETYDNGKYMITCTGKGNTGIKRTGLTYTPPDAPKITMSDEVAEKIANTMDIYSKRGTAVRLQMKDGEIFGGYDSDKKHALKYLKPDTIYHVKSTDVQNWTTDVYLEEVPDQWFNSVMFERVK